MVFASIREHAEHFDFFASTSRDKKFALRAASSLESTTREQRALLTWADPGFLLGGGALVSCS